MLALCTRGSRPIPPPHSVVGPMIFSTSSGSDNGSECAGGSDPGAKAFSTSSGSDHGSECAGGSDPGAQATSHSETPCKKRRKAYVWKDENKKQFVTDILYKQGHSQSFRALADRYRIDRSQQLPMLVIAVAQCIMDETMSAWITFLNFLARLQKDGKIKCMRFTWFVMADETPTRNKVNEIDKEGHVQENEQIAKVMASQTKFSLIFQTVDTNSNGASKPNAYCIVHGALPTKLQGMENQTAGVVLTTLRRQAAPPSREVLQRIFKELHRFDNTDLHPSMLSAFRQEARDAPSWRHGHIRCSAHRIRSAELYALAVDLACDSFFLNLTLSLRSSGTMTTFRRRARMWANRVPIRIYHGEPPEDVVRWRERVMGRFRSRVESGDGSMHEVQLLHAWDVYFTGDGRRVDEVQHYHTNGCARDDNICIDRCRRDGFNIVLKKQPKRYSRRTWHGHIKSVDHIIYWESLHGMLSQNYGDVHAQAAARAANVRSQRAAVEAVAAAAKAAAKAGAPNTANTGNASNQAVVFLSP